MTDKNATSNLNFVFARRRNIELEGGFTLAGFLVTRFPKGTKPRRKQMREVGEIIQHLNAAAASGRMDNDAVIYAWDGGKAPPTDPDDETVQRWAESRMTVEVRVDPRPASSGIKIDSEMVRQLGLEA